MDYSATEENMVSFMQVVCYDKPTWHDNFCKPKSFSEKGNLSIFLGFVQCWQRKKKKQNRGKLPVIRKMGWAFRLLTSVQALLLAVRY